MKLLTERLPLTVASVTIFEHLYRREHQSYWLDSSSESAGQGRFSFMGDASGTLGRVLSYDVVTRQLTVTSRGGAETLEGDVFAWLTTDLRRWQLSPADLPFQFRLGWVGYLGYELKADCGGDQSHASPYPDALLIFSCRGIAIDHQEKWLYLLALVDERNGEQQIEQQEWLARTRKAVLALADGANPDAPHPASSPPSPAKPIDVQLRHDRDAYLRLIAECKEEIRHGESYEICLTNMAFADTPIDPWESYLALRRVSPTALSAWFAAGDFWVLSGSPERFMRVDESGNVESKPIKGTRPRGRTPEEDMRLKSELLESPKERAENLMIVDLVRNDIGMRAEVGSVSVPKLFHIESYATVHQMVSTVVGKLDATSTAVDVIRASFPGGSMTGAPKKRTMELIDRLEGGYRGVYSGAIGYFSLNGASDFSIVIRTIVATKAGFSFGVGGAITYLSDPADEFEETIVKSRTISQALNVRLPVYAAREEEASAAGASTTLRAAPRKLWNARNDLSNR